VAESANPNEGWQPTKSTERNTEGGVASPLLANIFLHHAFDEWIGEKFPTVPFARYADDIVVHCKTEKQAKYVLHCIRERLQLWHLELHPEKTKIVYCKDGQRTGKYPQEEFDFLGFTFRQRTSRGQGGRLFMGFLPAISKKASKDKAEKIRSWKIQKRTDLALKDLAQMCNPKVRGWINYYGAFYKAKLVTVLLPINWKLAKWAKRKYNLPMREAWKWLAGVCRKCPQLFAHWKFGLIIS
jgi:RNA-directed DNA polymerase